MQARRAQIKAVEGSARGLFSADTAQQLAACTSFKELYFSPQPDNGLTGGDLLNELSKASLACGSLSERLLELAVAERAAAANATAQQQRERAALASVVWDVLGACCKHSNVRLLQELHESPKLEAALVATLRDLKEGNSREQASAMLLLESFLGHSATQDEIPAWATSLLPVAVKALEVGPVTGALGIVASALEVVWEHAAHPALKPLLPRVVAAILTRQLYLQRPVTSKRAALVLGAAASRRFGTAAQRKRMKDVDLLAVVEEAQWGTNTARTEMGYIQASMYLADHPSFQEHAVQWLVPHLVATLYRHDSVATRCGLVDLLPELLQQRPDLAEPFAAKGLMTVLACILVIRHSDQYAALNIARTVLLLAQQAPDSLGAAALESQALKAALECTFGVDMRALQRLASNDVKRDIVLPMLQQTTATMHSINAEAAASNAARLKQLKRLRMCAWAGCSRVEDTRGSSLKVCAACKDQMAAVDGGSGSDLDYKGSKVAAAVYCGRECQVADRYTGHAACLLEPLVTVPLASVTVQQRKQLLKLLGCADNSAMIETLAIVLRLFEVLAGTQALSSLLSKQHVVTWINAGLAKQLAACMAAMVQRRIWLDYAGSYTDRTADMLEGVVKVTANVMSSAHHSASSAATPNGVPLALLQFQQQLCADGMPWLGLVLSEVAAEHVAGKQHWALLENIAIVSVNMVKLRPYVSEGAAMEAEITTAVSKAATPALLDAMAEWALKTEILRSQHPTTTGPGPCFFLLSLMVQTPAQRQHLASHPAFVDAVCCALAPPQRLGNSDRVAAWSSNTDGALNLLCQLAMNDQGAADALGKVADRVVPLLFDLLVPPPGRPAQLCNPAYRVRSAVAALQKLTRSRAAVAFIHKSGWLLKHQHARKANWSPEEAELVQGLVVLVHPEVDARGGG